MRTLITTLLVSLFIIAFAGVAMAELDMDAKSFYAQGILSLPSGDFGDFAGTGFGGGLGMKVPFSELLNFRAEVGYIMYAGKEWEFFGQKLEYDFSMIPITVLGEYKMNEEDPYFLLGGVGLTMAKSEWTGTATYVDILGDTYTETISGDDSSSEFTLTLGGGYEINEQIAIEGRFNIISDTNYISVHGTYGF